MKTLIIDNFDSFTYNIFQYVAELGGNPTVIRNDKITIQEIKNAEYTHIILSPGPGNPQNKKDFGICSDIIKEVSTTHPILGICLGHQGIIAAFGGEVVRAPKPVHGKQSTIKINTTNRIFRNLPEEIKGMRYHSLIGKKDSLPTNLNIIAESTEDNLIMGVAHESLPLFGVQFHPESIGTPEGKQILRNFLQIKKSYTAQAMEEIMDEMIAGKYEEQEMANFLQELAERGETIEEITGAVRSLRKHAVKIPFEMKSELIDTCGTGGSGMPRMNISTAVAFVLAAVNTPVAKHGNRAQSGRCGSFDLLEALGVNINLNAEQVTQGIEMHNIGLLYAPLFHPAFKIFAPVRKKINTKTIFNLLGPLVNPANPQYHLLGTTSTVIAEKLIEVMKKLQYKRAMVVVGENGLDEVMPDGKTFCYELHNGKITTFLYEAKEKFKEEKNEEIGTVKRNAEIFIQLLDGNGPKKLQYQLEVNCGFALYIAGKTNTIEEGVIRARDSVRSGKALQKFKDYKKYSTQQSQ